MRRVRGGFRRSKEGRGLERCARRSAVRALRRTHARTPVTWMTDFRIQRKAATRTAIAASLRPDIANSRRTGPGSFPRRTGGALAACACSRLWPAPLNYCNREKLLRGNDNTRPRCRRARRVDPLSSAVIRVLSPNCRTTCRPATAAAGRSQSFAVWRRTMATSSLYRHLLSDVAVLARWRT